MCYMHDFHTGLHSKVCNRTIGSVTDHCELRFGNKFQCIVSMVRRTCNRFLDVQKRVKINANRGSSELSFAGTRIKIYSA